MQQTQFQTYEDLWDMSLEELHNLHKRLHEKIYWHLVHPADTCDDLDELQALTAKVEQLIQRRSGH